MNPFDFRYPFDTQSCPLQLMRPDKFYNQFNMIWGHTPSIEKIENTEYDVQHYLEYDNSTLPKTVVGVKIILCRKLSYHIINIYIPTLCLILITGFTLWTDFSHFEVNMMVALTSMLVTYTLYQSISGYLPHTSYMKMIDIWLFGGMIFPFFIISILVIMDSLIMQEKNLVLDLNDEKNQRLKSTTFMKTMKIMLLIVGSTLFLIYWVVGLYHYYSACPI